MIFNRFFNLALSAVIAVTVVVLCGPAWCGETVKTAAENQAVLAKIETQLAKKPGDVELQVQRALAMGRLERYEEQLSLSKLLCLKYPKLREAKKSMAYSLFCLKRSAEALDALNQTFALGSPSASELLQRAILLAELDRYSEALKDVNVVIKDNNADEHAFFLRAECYFHLNGPCKQASSDLEQTLKINPSREDARKLLVYMNKKITAGSTVK